ncbi:MAG: DNA primase [Spiroplasma sp.]
MNLEFKQKIQNIKEAVNIVDVVGQYLKLNHKGNNFWTICPFHEDSNPSLSVSQDKQIYKCFSCGEQGNVFIFLQKYKNIDFFSALKEVAKIAKIDLKDFDLEITDVSKKQLHKFNILSNLALIFYQYQLTTVEGKQAIEYLKQRKINDENINNFGLGYAPSNNQLLEYLQLQGYQQIDIIESGLAKVTKKDKVKDMFFNRITFPIVDLEGNCLGFSARKYFVQSKDNFKYINTPETKIFKKGQILYNLYNAKKAITVNNNNIYLVEGYMDVISLSNQNINNCVALMGTNLTKEQINILNKITKNIIIFLDGDEAGKLAAFKIAINLLANDFNVKIVNNPTDLDPDELINKQKEKFNEIIKNTLHPLDFAINFFLRKYDIKKDSYQLKEFLLQLKPLWKVIKDPVTLKFYLDSLQKITNLSQQDLLLVFELQVKPIIKPNVPIVKVTKRKFIRISLQEKLLEVQKQLFFLLLLDRSVYLFLEKEKFLFYNKELMNLYFLIGQKYQEDEKLVKINLEEILVLLKDNEIFAFLQLLINQHKNKNYQITVDILQDYLRIIKKYLIEIEIENLNHQITNSNDFDTKVELLKKMSVLKNKLNE